MASPEHADSESPTNSISSNASVEDNEFHLRVQLRDGLWLACRVGDENGEKFLARRIDDFPKDADGVGLREMMYHGKMAPLLSLTLSHENLVSLVGQIRLKPNPTSDRDETYLVTDYCDASNLTALLRRIAPNHDDSPPKHLPEGLCWHVLRSLVRAVTYLHDGKRWVYDYEAESASELRKWQLMDPSWHAILHRQINPGNVLFQHPRGRETYGSCKLGNFTNAVVTCYMPGSINRNAFATPADTNVEAHDAPLKRGLAIAIQKDWTSRDEMLKLFQRDPESMARRLYTLREELYSIGSVLFHMMTGRKATNTCEKSGHSHIIRCKHGDCLLRQAYLAGCYCNHGGCEHIKTLKCAHGKANWELCSDTDCKDPIINIDELLPRSPFSDLLRRQVEELLAEDGREPKNGLVAEASGIADRIELAYWKWRKETAEGRRYRDVEDVMMEVWLDEQEGTERDRLRRQLRNPSYFRTFNARN
ncbi:kinase-like domain-containing protein [Stachybotrys elegans]|uniref:non-specific serine/threonine protein kinase n=1 Tax=Stachybotrys elegans TaxID=80388 RepID=A0A8K0SJQ3_9HYPO|nr:kinase-like domain-containing protein [Stachybotrys elegans]